MAIEYITTPLNGNSGSGGGSAPDNTKMDKPTGSTEGMTAIVNPDGASVSWDWEQAKWVKVDTSSFPNPPKSLGIRETDDDLQKILDKLVSFEAAASNVITDSDDDTKIEVEKTVDEDKIRFTISGVNKGVWGTNGLGIGVTTPTALIDLGGAIRLRGRLKDGDNTEGTDGQILSTTGTKTKWIDNVVLGKTRFMNLVQISLTGGGTISHNSNDRFKWSDMFMSISLPKKHDGIQSVHGHFNIEMPPVGTVINGLGSSPDTTVDSEGILLAKWYTLYYKLPSSREKDSENGNFYHLEYNYDNTTVDEDMVFIAVCGKQGVIRIGDGRTIEQRSGDNALEYLADKADITELGRNRFMQLAQNTITGGGTVTHKNGRIKWGTRFISISLPKVHNGLNATDGYFAIDMPPEGTTIHGLGGTPDETVNSDGIVLSVWYVLYYKIPSNKRYHTQSDNFYILKYQHTATIVDDDMIMIAVHGQNGTVLLGDGRRIKQGSGDNALEYLTDKANENNVTALIGKNRFMQLVQHSLTGGGTVTHSHDRIKWDSRFISISLPKVHDGLNAEDGYFAIDMPPIGTAIKGLGSTPDDAVDSNGIPMLLFYSLYYKIPADKKGDTNMDNFYISKYAYDSTTVDNDMILIATHSDNDTITIGDGRKIKRNAGANKIQFLTNKVELENGVLKVEANNPTVQMIDGLTAGFTAEVDGKLVDFGTNYNQVGNRDNSKMGGFFRIDTRSNYPDQFFSVFKHAPNSTESILMQLTNSGLLKAKSLEVEGYTKLGSDSPSIKTKVVTGVTSNSGDGIATISHGIQTSKIISMTYQIQYGTENQIVYGYYDEPGYKAVVYSDTEGDFKVQNVTGQADSILNKPITFFVTYRE